MIKAEKEGYPVIWVDSYFVIKVHLEGLTLTGGFGPLSCQSPLCPDGLRAHGWAQVTLTNVRVSDNEDFGLVVWDSAQVAFESSQVSDNGLVGLNVGESTRVILKNSHVSDNGATGFWVMHSAWVTIERGLIEGNGTDERCRTNPYWICNGIEVWHEAHVELINSQILGNADWGVGAFLSKCGYRLHDFTGKVTFEAMELEDISVNNTSGNQDGMGNPGNHPWNRPEVLDGQVCLP